MFGVTRYDGGKDAKGNENPDLIEGWSWSSLYGFICWGSTCKTMCTLEEKEQNKCPTPEKIKELGGSMLTPDNSGPIATITKKPQSKIKGFSKRQLQEKDVHVVKGWARILQLGEQGWISLSGCPKGESDSEKCYGLQFDPDTNEFRGWAWNNRVGWIAFSGKTLYDTPYAYAEKGGERFEIRGTVIVTPDGEVPVSNAGSRGFTIRKESACLTQEKCEEGAYQEQAGKGRWSTQYVGPWTQTTGGNVFSRKGFEIGVGPFTEYQAFTGEYKEKIDGVEKSLKGAISGVAGCDVSEKKCKDKTTQERQKIGLKQTEAEKVTQERPDIRIGSLKLEFPQNSKKTALVSKLGTIQKKALITPSGEGKRNAYGYEVVESAGIDASLTKILGSGLGGKIYLYKNTPDKPLMIGSKTDRASWQIANTSAISRRSAAGTIVAYGTDIKIYRPIRYDQTFDVIKEFRQLASVAWIALKDENDKGGNIIIDHCIPPLLTGVTDPLSYIPIDGLFFAEGKISTGTGSGQDCVKEFEALKKDPKNIFKPDIASIIASFRQGNSAIDIPLNIEGIVAANLFDLERVYGGLNRGSELIQDTARTQINPPPGIGDIIRSLPVR